ncbi:hypothetical protein JZ751_002785 [Albula glossodonta]|uniref:Uncharacterized protein n=1 Tax=Albula glossodonta TaxID=121402 RepID=A0A8T2NFJ1_9TELE|nr:hypothetical protein JZ751_002785 [Albula glossodonta]
MLTGWPLYWSTVWSRALTFCGVSPQSLQPLRVWDERWCQAQHSDTPVPSSRAAAGEESRFLIVISLLAIIQMKPYDTQLHIMKCVRVRMSHLSYVIVRPKCALIKWDDTGSSLLLLFTKFGPGLPEA